MTTTTTSRTDTWTALYGPASAAEQDAINDYARDLGAADEGLGDTTNYASHPDPRAAIRADLTAVRDWEFALTTLATDLASVGDDAPLTETATAYLDSEIVRLDLARRSVHSAAFAYLLA